MLRMLCVSIVLLSFSLLAKEQYAVVKAQSVDLLNDHGETSLELPEGSIVKVNSSIVGERTYEVEVNQEVYSASSSSFRTVTSMSFEAKRLKEDISDLNQTINQLDERITNYTKNVNDRSKKIFELKLWIEVQRDFCFSKESYLAKVKGSLNELKQTTTKMNRANLQKVDLLGQKKMLLTKVNFLVKSLELVHAQVKKVTDSRPDKGSISLQFFAGR
jgi:predicted nuclease with TOPRIM domain